jgi:thiol-disulfide isomerase/thioredoxin
MWYQPEYFAATAHSLKARPLFSARLLVVLAVFIVAATRSARAEIKVGDSFPDLRSVSLEGGAVPDTKGRVTLVDFWASWCAPCKASFPAFARLNTAYADRGLVIVAVSVDEAESAYRAFVKRWHPPFPALLDEGQKLVTAVKVPTMPTSYLIGRDGRVRFVHSGFHGAETEELLRRRIDAVLGEQP